MIEFLTLITLMCNQPGVSPARPSDHAETRQEAFAAQSQCIKKLHTACAKTNEQALYMKSKLVVEECLVKQL